MPEQIYHPKENHPWRQYRNRKTVSDDKPQVPQMSLKEFLKNIVDNFDTYKIPPNNFEDREYISLCKIEPSKQAEWLIGFVKKHWLSNAVVYE